MLRAKQSTRCQVAGPSSVNHRIKESDRNIDQKTLDYNHDKAYNPLKNDIDRGNASIADVRILLERRNYAGGKSYPFIDATGEASMFEIADNDYWEYYPMNPSTI